VEVCILLGREDLRGWDSSDVEKKEVIQDPSPNNDKQYDAWKVIHKRALLFIHFIVLLQQSNA
jgi:hypothetical protein